MSCCKVLANNGAHLVLMCKLWNMPRRWSGILHLAWIQKGFPVYFPQSGEYDQMHSFGLLKVLSPECVCMNIDF